TRCCCCMAGRGLRRLFGCLGRCELAADEQGQRCGKCADHGTTLLRRNGMATGRGRFGTCGRIDGSEFANAIPTAVVEVRSRPPPRFHSTNRYTDPSKWLDYFGASAHGRCRCGLEVNRKRGARKTRRVPG